MVALRVSPASVLPLDAEGRGPPSPRRTALISSQHAELKLCEVSLLRYLDHQHLLIVHVGILNSPVHRRNARIFDKRKRLYMRPEASLLESVAYLRAVAHTVIVNVSNGSFESAERQNLCPLCGGARRGRPAHSDLRADQAMSACPTAWHRTSGTVKEGGEGPLRDRLEALCGCTCFDRCCRT